MGVKFKGGKELENLLLKAGKGSISSVAIGFFDTAKYIDGTYVADVAVTNEFGLGVPERSFFRQANEVVRKKLIAVIKKFVDPKTLRVDMRIGGLLGEVHKSAVQQSIVDLREPPNSPATIRAKGGKDNPLIDTSTMVNAVTYRVNK